MTTYLSESFLAATRLALGLPSTAVPRGPKVPYRCKVQPAEAAFDRTLHYPALTPPRSSGPGRSVRPGPAAPCSSQSCR